MKRRCKEGIHGLKADNPSIGLFAFISIFLFSSLSHGQVPINGFCGVSELNLDKSFTSIQSVSFNDDGYTDLFLYNSKNGQCEILQGQDNLKFTKKWESRPGFKLSAVSYVNSRSSNDLVFLSRESRQYGLLKINSSGIPSFRVIEKLSSFPENVTTVELENDKSPEYILNGSSFRGIGILKNINAKVNSKSFSKNSSFSLLQTGDFNSDGYPDICAYDIKTSTVNMFYNNSRGDMRYMKGFQTGGAISNLKAFDFNLDNYEDFSYCRGRDILFHLGDSVHSYRRVIKVTMNKMPRKVIYGDFNQDGKIDFAYLNDNMNSLSVVFQRDSLKFYSEIEYISETSLIEIVPFYSRYTNGFAVLSGRNKIYFFSQVHSLGNSVNLAPCSALSTPFSFDYQNDGLTDIGILDRKQQSVNLLLRNKNGIPFLFLRLPLTIQGVEMNVDESKPDEKVFYVTDSSACAMEIIHYNFKDSVFSRKSIPLAGKLVSARMSYFSGEGRLLCVLNKTGELIYNRMSGEKVLYSHSIAKLTDRERLLDGQILKTGDYFFASQNRDTVQWFLYSYKNHSLKTMYKMIDKKQSGYRTFVYDFYNNGFEQMLIMKKDGDRYTTTISHLNGRSIPVMFKNDLGKNIELTGNQYFGQYGASMLNRFFIQTGKEKIARFDFLRSKHRILVSEYDKLEDVGNFIIRNLSGENYSLIYTHRTKNYLAVERI